ncbi:MAG: alpha/beta hydrolase [Gemmatimonadetes bacterium]|nr:alpha/beta hydrolase [Gemmatimonadota bacterium]
MKWGDRAGASAPVGTRRSLLAAALLSLPALAWSQERPTYEESFARIARQQAVDDSVAARGARTIFLTNGARTARVVVLFHGLTDSPRQFESLAQLLHDAGDNVYVPRLPRHGVRGGSAHTFAGLTADELRQCADSSVDIASGLGDTVIVAGLSLGGTMAAWIAQHREVARAVIIAPAIEAGRIPSILERPIVGLADRIPNITRRAPSDTARPDREPGIATHAIARILQLGMSVLKESRRTAAPTPAMTILVNANDRTVKESAAEELARQWARHGARVSLYELPDSLRLPHNIVDPFRGAGGGPLVLQLLEDLIHDEPPSMVVRRLMVPTVAPAQPPR